MKKIKMITLGDSGVWKTSIINRIKDGIFKNDYSVTINIDHFLLEKSIKKNWIIKMVSRDTEGSQEVFKIKVSFSRK